MGEERAEAVRLFLNEQGVALNRMNTISYGETAPVADNKSKAGRSRTAGCRSSCSPRTSCKATYPGPRAVPRAGSGP
ncbi:MAG: OmpA family protein [Caulobacteraceae bacterium]